MRTGAPLAAALVALLSFLFTALLLASAGAYSSPADGPSGKPATGDDQEGVGYEDTPVLPGSTWRVHDKHRPVPAIVAPGPAPAQAGPVPADATVLLKAGDASAWNQGGKPVTWKFDGDALVVTGGGNIETNAAFGDCQMHLEFATPPAEGESQGRGNSGLFLMGRYEVQILDSFNNRTYADGQCAALYGQYPPLVNAARAPGEWQTYDLVFRAPRFDGERLVSPARITLLHNGVLVHDNQEFLGATQHRAVANYAAHAEKLPIGLQDHGNPMRFRNIWIRPL